MKKQIVNSSKKTSLIGKITYNLFILFVILLVFFWMVHEQEELNKLNDNCESLGYDIAKDMLILSGYKCCKKVPHPSGIGEMEKLTCTGIIRED